MLLDATTLLKVIWESTTMTSYDKILQQWTVVLHDAKTLLKTVWESNNNDRSYATMIQQWTEEHSDGATLLKVTWVRTTTSCGATQSVASVVFVRQRCWCLCVDVWMARWRTVWERDELRCGTLLLAKVSSRLRFQLLSQKQPWTNLVTLLKSNKTKYFFTHRLKPTTTSTSYGLITFLPIFGWEVWINERLLLVIKTKALVQFWGYDDYVRKPLLKLSILPV